MSGTGRRPRLLRSDADGLGRIRDVPALSGPGPAPAVPRAYHTGRTLPDPERLDLLVDRLVDYKATVRTRTADRTAEVIAAALRERGARRVVAPTGRDGTWLADYEGEVRPARADVPAPRPAAVDGVVTASAVTCAETGTIFLDGFPDQVRRALSLVPDRTSASWTSPRW